jgi:high-affinity Fe2+/Pb2+ permease
VTRDIIVIVYGMPMTLRAYRRLNAATPWMMVAGAIIGAVAGWLL